MSRLSQCATCDRGRWNCGHYTPEDDTECPYYLHYRVQEYEELMTVREFTFVSLSIVLVLAVLLYLIYVSEPYALILIAFEFVVLFIYWMIKRRKYKKQQEIMGARTASVMNEKEDNNDIPVSRIGRNAKMVFVFNDAEKKVDIHTILNAIFVEQIHNLDQLLRAYLDVVLSSHQQFYNIMEQLRRQAHSSQE